jgi:hypothetical protein
MPFFELRFFLSSVHNCNKKKVDAACQLISLEQEVSDDSTCFSHFTLFSTTSLPQKPGLASPKALALADMAYGRYHVTT